MTNFLLILFTFAFFVITLYLLRKNKQPMGICHICNKNFLDKKLLEIDQLFLCEKDFEFYKKTKFIDFYSTKSDPEHPEFSLHINDFKNFLISNDVPCFIKTDYKDFSGVIHSYFTLKIAQDKITVLNDLFKHNQKFF